MNLKTFNRTDCKFNNDGTPRICVSKVGLFTFNKHAVNKLELQKNEKIEIHQDQEQTIDWYISKTNNPDGLILRGNTAGGLCTNAQKIAKILLKSINKTGQTSSFRLAIVPEKIKGKEYYAILTRSINAETKKIRPTSPSTQPDCI